MNTARLDVSDPALGEAVIKVRSDASPETFCLFGYEGKSKIVLKTCGTGSVYSALDALEDEAVSYGLLRITGTRDQESKTVKFVFVCYVGPSVGGMARGRVGAHKGDIKGLVGQSHVDIQTDDKTDLSEDSITTRLKKASGANYDLGSNAGGAYESKAGDIGKSAAARYRELEKQSNIGPVVFDKGPAKPKDYVTPVDLGGRPMVAPPTAAKANVVLRDETTAAKAEKDAVTAAEKAAALAARGRATSAAPPPPPPPNMSAPQPSPPNQDAQPPEAPALGALPEQPAPAVDAPRADAVVDVTDASEPSAEVGAAQDPAVEEAPQEAPSEDQSQAAPPPPPPPPPPAPVVPAATPPAEPEAGQGTPAVSSYADGDVTPKGTILHAGALSKAGSGLLARKYTPRHCVIHRLDGGAAFLSVYEDASCTAMKGSRLHLDGRASARADDEDSAVFYVEAHDEKTSVAQETITQSYTSVAVTAKFKAGSAEDAAAWMEYIQRAIDGV